MELTLLELALDEQVISPHEHLRRTTEPSAAAARPRRFANAVLGDLPLLAMLAAFVAEPSTCDFALVNLLVQATMFGLGACLPAYRTSVMAFADCV